MNADQEEQQNGQRAYPIFYPSMVPILIPPPTVSELAEVSYLAHHPAELRDHYERADPTQSTWRGLSADGRLARRICVASLYLLRDKLSPSMIPDFEAFLGPDELDTCQRQPFVGRTELRYGQTGVRFSAQELYNCADLPLDISSDTVIRGFQAGMMLRSQMTMTGMSPSAGPSANNAQNKPPPSMKEKFLTLAETLNENDLDELLSKLKSGKPPPAASLPPPKNLQRQFDTEMVDAFPQPSPTGAVPSLAAAAAQVLLHYKIPMAGLPEEEVVQLATLLGSSKGIVKEILVAGIEAIRGTHHQGSKACSEPGVGAPATPNLSGSTKPKPEKYTKAQLLKWRPPAKTIPWDEDHPGCTRCVRAHLRRNISLDKVKQHTGPNKCTFHKPVPAGGSDGGSGKRVRDA